jgi:hypothetical protein
MKNYYQHGIQIYTMYGIVIAAFCSPACHDVIPIPSKKGEYLSRQNRKHERPTKKSKLLRKF